jgi:hypothetical protein
MKNPIRIVKIVVAIIKLKMTKTKIHVMENATIQTVIAQQAILHSS